MVPTGLLYIWENKSPFNTDAGRHVYPDQSRLFNINNSPILGIKRFGGGQNCRIYLLTCFIECLTSWTAPNRPITERLLFTLCGLHRNWSNTATHKKSIISLAFGNSELDQFSAYIYWRANGRFTAGALFYSFMIVNVFLYICEPHIWILFLNSYTVL